MKAESNLCSSNYDFIMHNQLHFFFVITLDLQLCQVCFATYLRIYNQSLTREAAQSNLLARFLSILTIRRKFEESSELITDALNKKNNI